MKKNDRAQSQKLVLSTETIRQLKSHTGIRAGRPAAQCTDKCDTGGGASNPLIYCFTKF